MGHPFQWNRGMSAFKLFLGRKKMYDLPELHLSQFIIIMTVCVRLSQSLNFKCMSHMYHIVLTS